MMKIDFVITWVDGNDPKWLEEKSKYPEDTFGTSRASRYRDWDNLKYWFRGVEQFAPWVNKIYFVTWGHVPSWLDITNEKLVVVNHKDYIPNEFLPTFSSRTIDMNLHRIQGLSEHFVYFNDDMFLLAPVKPSDFFKQGLPCDTAIMNAITFGYSESVKGETIPSKLQYTAPAFDMIPINRYFNKRKQTLKYWYKWFNPRYGMSMFRTVLLLPWGMYTGFMNYHLPYSYLKSSYEELWEKEPDLLAETCKAKYRNATQLNHWVFSYWQLASGKFMPRNPKIGKQFRIVSDSKGNGNLYDAIKNQKYKMICANDSVKDENYEEIKRELNSYFELILPNKSSFEI